MFDGTHASPPVLPCGTFRLDLARRLLLDPSGRPVKLRARSFDLLKVLLLHSGRIVSRDELLDAVWGSIHVTEDSVTQCVVEIRRALGGRAGMLLRTVPRYGYMLEPEAMGDAAAIAIAVDRFAALGCAGAEALGEGICRDLIVDLAKAGGLRILARGALPGEEPGRLAGVDYVIEGSVRCAGRRLRITAQLVEAHSAHLVWAERYDCEDAQDTIGAQDDVVGRISGAVRRVLHAPRDARTG